MAYVIDGLFLTKKITGIQRFSYEICKELDKIACNDEFEILVPESSDVFLNFKKIKIIRYGKHKGRLWEQFDLRNYLKKNNKEGIFLTNELPLLYKKGIICIHDISYKVNPYFFCSFKDRISSYWHRLNYYCAFNSDMEIITVSKFSKNEIKRVYKVDHKRITVINNAWQHLIDIDENNEILNRFDFKNNDYCFSMLTLALNKNFKWILSAAKNNSDMTFAIAGDGKLKDVAAKMGYANLPNVFFLGYVTDEDAKSLMHHCRAFLFPTLYEGFGIPPLEAIASGCKRIIVSDIPVMHEIYGDYVYYINPYDYENIRLNEIRENKDADCVLKNYSWKGSAEILYNLTKSKKNRK